MDFKIKYDIILINAGVDKYYFVNRIYPTSLIIIMFYRR